MKTNLLFWLSFAKRLLKGTLFLMLFTTLSSNAQVMFPQTLNADFHKGNYNDMLVASDNVYLPFQATNVGTWLTTTVLPQTLMGHKAAVWNNRYVYVVGGYNDITYTNTVYRATLQAGGVSGWTELNPLPVGLRDHAVVIGTNTIYVLGGRDATNLYNTIYFATINADGSIGDWQTSAESLTVPLWGHTTVYSNGYIYVAGGAHNLTATTARSNVYYAKVLADNTLSTFAAATVLPSTRNGHSMVVQGDKVYVLGGFANGGAKVNTVYSATSGVSGTLGAWTTETALPITVSNHSSVIMNGLITVLAGESGGTLKNTVYYATITASPLVWTLAADAMYDFTRDGAAFCTNGQIGYCGGQNLSATPIHNTRYANLTLSANYKKTGLFVSNPFYELGAERVITQLTFTSTVPAGATVGISYRVAGNDKIWGNWTAASTTSPIAVSQTKQYLQYKVVFTSNGTPNATFHDLNLFTQGTQLAGNLNAMATFTQAASPYWATADISFTAGTHTFQAGTVILFLPNVLMTVGQANIICSGTVADSVKFLSFTNEPGTWQGIYFNPDSDNGVSSQFNYTTIAYGGQGGNTANLYSNGSNEPLLNNCFIRNSSNNGLRMNGSHVNLNNCTIKNNGSNAAYLATSNPTFNTCTLTNNVGAGVYMTSSACEPTFNSTTLSNNMYGLRYPSPDFSILPPNGSLTMTNNTYNGICMDEGVVSENRRWYYTSFDFIMLGNLTIGKYSNVCRLTIEPGNRVKFLPGKRLQVGFYSGFHQGGELYAIGSDGNPVTFTPYNNVSGGWEGIYFEDRSDWSGAASVMNYCIVEKGNEYNIYVENTNQPTMNNCTIRNAVQDGMKFYAGYNIINTTAFQNNGRYPLYFAEPHTLPVLSGNTYTGNNINLIGYSGGSVSENRTFQNDGINYHILDNILIGKYSDVRRLTIAKGLTLYFNSGKGIQVGYYSGYHHGGEIYAIGKADSTITFTPYSGVAGDWTGIYFEDRSDWSGATNHLKYCIIEKANDFNVYCENTSSVTIENCTIRNAVTDGLRYYGGYGSFINSTFNNNGRYPVNYTEWSSSPVHSNNTFTANGTNMIALSGGAYTENRTITKDNAEYLVLDNILIGKYGAVSNITIEPGVYLNFASGKNIQVGYYSGWHHGGSLYAEGNADNRIVIRPASLINGDWGGIFFEDRSDWNGATSSLKYCTIIKGNEYNIRCNLTTQPTIDNSIITQSTGYGLLIENSILNITRSRIANNTGNGIYLDGSSNATIGNADSLTCTLYSNGSYHIYNNTANNVQARYNYLGTCDSTMVSLVLYDKSDNNAKGQIFFTPSAHLPNLTTATTTVSGSVKYANAGANPMKNAAMKINKFDGTQMASTTTNTSGNYAFAAINSGFYQMSITPTNAWGGVNATDALGILRHFAQIELLTGMKLAAADVNYSHTINGTDALFVMKRYSGIITSFPVGDYLFHNETVTLGTGTITNHVKMICFGDVDASYGPTKKTSNINLEYNGTQEIQSFTAYDVQVKIHNPLQIGAISIGFYYPEEFMSITGVELPNGSSNVLWSAENGLFRMAWCDLNGYNTNMNDVFLTLKMTTKDLTNLNADIALDLYEDSELADASTYVHSGVVLDLPKLTRGATGIDHISDEYHLSVYPNPAVNKTFVDITLKNNCYMKLSLLNTMGIEVQTIAENHFMAGNHTIPLDVNGLSAGVYILKVQLVTAGLSSQQRVKVVVAK